MASVNEIDSVTHNVQEPSEIDYIKDIHIGVFFDGTNNNMVQQLCYSSDLVNISLLGIGKRKASILTLEKEKEILSKKLEDYLHSAKSVNEANTAIEETEKRIQAIDERIKAYNEKISQSEKSRQSIYDLRARLHKENLRYNSILCLSEYGSSELKDADLKLMAELKETINKIEEEIDFVSATFDVTEQELMDYSDEKGYSNIAVLYSLFNITEFENAKEQPSKAIKFYIEGSGKSDMGDTIGMTANGLGFGLGLTGVTALVSKGIMRVTKYVDNLSERINNTTKIHFYVFGFSRGATCARLFTHIATRDIKDKLTVREHEFKDFIPSLMGCNGIVKFLDRITNRNNITVDFLGIYDTVASIGLLKQKDGWMDPLGAPYKNMPNYRNNWHYKNATQYGLYPCLDSKKLLHICHIGALDEFRENFAFTNIGKEIRENAIEILIPGCHSDVGGGYMTGDEQEISMPYYVDKEVKEEGKQVIKTMRTLVFLKSYFHDPSKSNNSATSDTESNLSDKGCAPFNLDSLEYLGWINKWKDEKKRKKKERTTITVAEHANKVYFKRYVKRGWSDVALLIMIDRASICMPSIFTPPVVYDYKKTILDCQINKLAEKTISKCKDLKEKKRYAIIPDGNISSELYKWLRLNYLHFTSSSSMFHFKWVLRNWELNSIGEGSVGNIGNKPNFDMNGTLCRIMYHGDKCDSLIENEDDNEHSQHVHYIYESNCDKVSITL